MPQVPLSKCPVKFRWEAPTSTSLEVAGIGKSMDVVISNLGFFFISKPRSTVLKKPRQPMGFNWNETTRCRMIMDGRTYRSRCATSDALDVGLAFVFFCVFIRLSI